MSLTPSLHSQFGSHAQPNIFHALNKLQAGQMPKKKLSHIPCDLTIFYYNKGPPMQSKFHHPNIFHTCLYPLHRETPKLPNKHYKNAENTQKTSHKQNLQNIPQSHRNPTKNPALNPYKLYRETPNSQPNPTKNTQKQCPCKPKWTLKIRVNP